MGSSLPCTLSKKENVKFLFLCHAKENHEGKHKKDLGDVKQVDDRVDGGAV